MLRTKLIDLTYCQFMLKTVELLRFKVICPIKQKQLGSFFPCTCYLHVQSEKEKKPMKNYIHRSDENELSLFSPTNLGPLEMLDISHVEVNCNK